MARMIGIFVSAVVLFACSVDSPTPEADVSAPGTPEVSPASSSEATAEPLGITSDALTPAACQVTLNFCDAPGSIGTDCTQSGCDLGTAISACKTLVSSVGCTVLCNAVMRNSTGAIIDTWRQSCGGRCCPEGTFCFGTRCCPNNGGGVGCPS